MRNGEKLKDGSCKMDWGYGSKWLTNRHDMVHLLSAATGYLFTYNFPFSFPMMEKKQKI